MRAGAHRREVVGARLSRRRSSGLAKPPWNHPQVMPALFSRSPMFLPPVWIVCGGRVSVLGRRADVVVGIGIAVGGAWSRRLRRAGRGRRRRPGRIGARRIVERRAGRPADRAERVRPGHVDRARRRRTEVGPVRVVAHREVLGVVPQAGDGVAVVVVHDRVVGVDSGGWSRVPFRGQALRERQRTARLLHEHVHQAVVESALLVRVPVVLVARRRLSAVQQLRIRQVGVVGQKRPGQPVHRRRVRRGVERRLPGGIGGVGVGTEVVVERDVLLEDHDEMLDGRRGAGTASLTTATPVAVAMVRPAAG